MRATRACRLIHGESDGLPGVVADRYGGHGRAAAVFGRRRALARRDRRRARRGDRRSVRVRALGCRGAHARRTAAAHRRRARHAARPRDLRRGRPRLSRRRRSPARRRASISTSATIAPRCGLSPRDAKCSMCSATPAASRWRRSPAARRASSRSTVRPTALALAPREPRAQPGAPTRPRRVARGRRLRRVAQAARPRRPRFDLIVLDPPKFAPTAAHAERAARAYKDVNLLALKLLRARRAARDLLVLRRHRRRPFRKIVAGAALDAGADAQVMRRLRPAPIIRWRSPFPKATISRASRGSCSKTGGSPILQSDEFKGDFMHKQSSMTLLTAALAGVALLGAVLQRWSSTDTVGQKMDRATDQDGGDDRERGQHRQQPQSMTPRSRPRSRVRW